MSGFIPAAQAVLTIFSILAFLFASVGFVIKVFTGRDAGEVIHEIMHSHTTQRSQSIPQPHIVDTQLPPGSAGVSPPQPSPLSEIPPVQHPVVATQPPLVPRHSLRLLIPHPWLLGVSLVGFLLEVVSFILAQSNATTLSGGLFLLGFLVLLVAMISSAVSAVQERHWVWFIVVLLTFGYGAIFFSIFDRPKKQVTQPSQRPAAQLALTTLSETTGSADLRCPRCGTELTHPKRYCPRCGNPLKMS
jgi:hypothetical protein